MRKSLYVVLLCALLAVAAFTRLYDLSADPPISFPSGGEDLVTDGSCLTLNAKSAVQNDQWDPLGYHHWQEFKISLISGLSFLIFALAGTSLTTANLSGAILSLAALILFILGAMKLCTRRAVLFISLLLATDFVICLFGRLPFSENAMMFLCALAFVVYAYWSDRTFGKIMVGIVVALCGLLGKSYGFLILAGPLAYVLFQEKETRLKAVLYLLGPMLLTVLLYALLIPGDTGFTSFIWHHAAGEHGYPYGLQSPVRYVEKLISFAYNGLFAFAPVTSLICLLAFAQRLFRPRVPSEDLRVWYFMAGWLVAWVLVISPFNYLPLRYLFVLLVPLAVIAGIELDRIGAWRLQISGRPAVLSLIGLFLLNWYVIYYIVIYSFIDQRVARVFYSYTWKVLPFAAAATLVEWLVLRRWAVTVPGRLQKWAIIVLLAIAVVFNGRLFVDWFANRSYNLAEASADVSQLAGPSAVIAGQYGPALCSNGTLRGFPLFPDADIPATAQLLRDYPITHLAVRPVVWEAMVRSNDSLQAVPVVAKYWIRGNMIYLFRVAGFFGNPTAAAYEPTDLERSIDYRAARKFDSAACYLGRFRQTHPPQKSAMLETYYLTLNPDDLKSSQPLLDSLVNAYPTDVRITILAAVFYRDLHAQTGNAQFEAISIRYRDQSVRLNRRGRDAVEDAFRHMSPRQEVL